MKFIRAVDDRVAVFVVFFKQKTAYEMRISDWSSDVCSSDRFRSSDCADRSCQPSRLNQRRSPPCGGSRYRSTTIRVPARVRGAAAGGRAPAGRARMRLVWIRSEEHTSELQSLMRISYAVFSLKNKIIHTKTNIIKSIRC